jgi:hypothetical protein
MLGRVSPRRLGRAALCAGPEASRVLTSLRTDPRRQQSAHQHPQRRDARSGMVGSGQKRYAELRSDSTQILDAELSVSVGLSEVSEEGLEAGW